MPTESPPEYDDSAFEGVEAIERGPKGHVSSSPGPAQDVMVMEDTRDVGSRTNTRSSNRHARPTRDSLRVEAEATAITQTTAPTDRGSMAPQAPPRPRSGPTKTHGLLLAAALGFFVVGVAKRTLTPAAAPTPAVEQAEPEASTPQTAPTAEPSTPAAAAEAVAVPVVAPAADAPAVDPSADLPPAVSAWWPPTMPTPPQRAPHRPKTYTTQVPRGGEQTAAILAARRHDCGASMTIVNGAVARSHDYAPLYQQAWLCYSIAYHPKLLAAEATDLSGLRAMEPLFHGAAPNGTQGDAATWSVPPSTGLHDRIERWAHDSKEHGLQDVVADLLGAPRVADDLAADAWMIAHAARAYAQADPEARTVADVHAWARHVFYAKTALTGAPGALLQSHRPDAYAAVSSLVAQATTEHLDAEGRSTLPAAVAQASDGAASGLTLTQLHDRALNAAALEAETEQKLAEAAARRRARARARAQDKSKSDEPKPIQVHRADDDFYSGVDNP